MNFLLKMLLLGKAEEPIPDYQPWASYPDTPALTEDYPYQFIYEKSNGRAYLVCSDLEPYYYQAGEELNLPVGSTQDRYYKDSGDSTWSESSSNTEWSDIGPDNSYYYILKASNFNILDTDDNLWFEKTT